MPRGGSCHPAATNQRRVRQTHPRQPEKPHKLITNPKLNTDTETRTDTLTLTGLLGHKHCGGDEHLPAAKNAAKNADPPHSHNNNHTKTPQERV